MMRCLDCEYMACKEFFSKTELWTGFCLKLQQKITGNSECHTASKK